MHRAPTLCDIAGFRDDKLCGNKHLYVLITRPQEQAQKLSDLLKQNHISSIIFPAIKIIDAPRVDNFSSSFQKVIFTSPIAVEKAVHYQWHWPKAVEFFAIGSGTANAITQKNWGSVVTPKKFNSESLLALESLQHVQNQKVLLCRGAGGQADNITKTLRARGAHVAEAILYQRVLPTPNTLPELVSIDVIVITSQEALNNLCQLFVCDAKALKQKMLLVSSQAIKRLAKQEGFGGPIILASNATDEAILTTLLTLKGKRSHG